MRLPSMHGLLSFLTPEPFVSSILLRSMLQRSDCTAYALVRAGSLAHRTFLWIIELETLYCSLESHEFHRIVTDVRHLYVLVDIRRDYEVSILLPILRYGCRWGRIGIATWAVGDVKQNWAGL